MDERALQEHVNGCAGAHRTLVSHLESMLAAGTIDDAAVRAPSRLPGWSVGHVLAHLSRNADSHTRVIDGVLRGEVLDQYEGGAAGRNAEIESGAVRPAAEQVDDVRHSIARLELAWARCADAGWPGTWRSPMAGERPAHELPFRRWREVEVHHADLGLAGFGFDDWSQRYVAEELRMRTMEWSSRNPMGLTSLPQAALSLSPTQRLAWLLGRTVPEGLDPVQFV
jgi:maleylpyruvate isomerase